MSRPDDPSFQPDAVHDYLRTVLPFAELPESAVAGLSRHCRVLFRAAGEEIMAQGRTRLDGAYLIQKGGVRLFLQDESGTQTLVDVRGEGQFCGVSSLFHDGLADCHAVAVEDTFLIRIAKDAFLALVHSTPQAAQFFLKSLSENHLARVFEEMRQDRCPAGPGAHLLGARVSGLVARPAERIERGSSLRRAAGRMVAERIGSLLICEPSGEIIGIITDTDIRRAVALGLGHDAPAETVMSAPVAGIDAGASCYDALLAMMDARIHHLAVREEGRVTGVITAHDIILAQGGSPLALFRQIQAQTTLSGLYPLGGGLKRVVRALVQDGARAGTILRLTAMIRDTLAARVMALLDRDFGPAPLPWCLTAIGGEGRMEQGLRPGQGHALLMADNPDAVIRRAGAVFFRALAAKAAEHLSLCGFTRREGESAALACQPLTAWVDDLFARLHGSPSTDPARLLAWLDARPLCGQTIMGASLRSRLLLDATPDRNGNGADKRRRLARRLTRAFLEHKPPLSFFRNFIVEKDGAHRNTLDLKRRGIDPIVDFARLLAVAHGLPQTSTLERLETLRQNGALPPDLAADAREAFEFLSQLDLVSQLRAPDPESAARLDPATLSELEKRTMKESFAVVSRLQALARDSFDPL